VIHSRGMDEVQQPVDAFYTFVGWIEKGQKYRVIRNYHIPFRKFLFRVEVTIFMSYHHTSHENLVTEEIMQFNHAVTAR